jgi:hypothetical protein
MSDRENALRNIAVGDILHARNAQTGASLVCLVTGLDDAAIYARRIHTQDDVRFDRNTGAKIGTGSTTIDCVAPLPPEIHNTFLAMDRRYQDAHALIHQGSDMDPKFARWTTEERHAHRFLDEHIEANSI